MAKWDPRTECTPAERAFLDALKNSDEPFGEDREVSGCPFCTYSGLGPASKEIAESYKAVLAEWFGDVDASWFDGYQR